jgi:hypothetical protein
MKRALPAAPGFCKKFSPKPASAADFQNIFVMHCIMIFCRSAAKLLRCLGVSATNINDFCAL